MFKAKLLAHDLAAHADGVEASLIADHVEWQFDGEEAGLLAEELRRVAWTATPECQEELEDLIEALEQHATEVEDGDTPESSPELNHERN